ncbi:MAG: hypothetical protein DWQ31_12025 [Planctomycetota bacterium]|nr:MAG: hypothetical protein DWQ31_12025 [Planctomycetota bacterium]REJ87345.1 MAG: hypothetical protein DWQ35_21580 [Planctomycetota bacterium]REK24823.1 MAG: hypothetical protein DWQ42_12855 [Planctomycetota bacterium]REK49419.1 MAG: hypothetical protein DWQ46_00285 [Planctomycetota bacterium]
MPLLRPERVARTSIEGLDDFRLGVARLGNEDAIGRHDRPGVAGPQGNLPQLLERVFGQRVGPGGRRDLTIAGRTAPLRPRRGSRNGTIRLVGHRQGGRPNKADDRRSQGQGEPAAAKIT